MNNWIHVNDRLPSKSESRNLLVLCKHGRYAVSRYDLGYWEELNYKIPMKETELSDIEYWQPIPIRPVKKSVGNQEDGMIDGISQVTDKERLLIDFAEYVIDFGDNKNSTKEIVKEYINQL